MISTKYLCDIIPDDSKSLFWIKKQIILSSNNNYYMSYKEELIQYFSEDECMYILDFLHDSFVDITFDINKKNYAFYHTIVKIIKKHGIMILSF